MRDLLLSDWSSTAAHSPSGAVTSEQRAHVGAPVIEATSAGGYALGRRYWYEVERFTHGLVRSREMAAGVELRLLGGPILLRFGPAELAIDRSSVTCRYPVVGGLLALRPGGAISFSQCVAGDVELRSRLVDYHPRLGQRGGRPGWTGALYAHLQARLHVAVTRRFFEALAAEARR